MFKNALEQLLYNRAVDQTQRPQGLATMAQGMPGFLKPGFKGQGMPFGGPTQAPQGGMMGNAVNAMGQGIQGMMAPPAASKGAWGSNPRAGNTGIMGGAQNPAAQPLESLDRTMAAKGTKSWA